MIRLVRLKKTLKWCVLLMQKMLPEKVFDACYSIGFPAYKTVVRYLYLLAGIVLYGFSSSNKWRMVKKIFSIMPYTLVGIGGLEATYQAATDLNRRHIPGDFVELGVARGGCAALMGITLFDSYMPDRHDRKLWLFDSYEGLPDPTEEDFSSSWDRSTGDHVRPLPKGSCLGTLEEVKRLMFQIMNFPEDKLVFIKGWFQDTIPQTIMKIDKIALLRIDGDWYESTKCCLEGLYDKVVPGGAVIIDDYESCYGCKKAVDEFISDRCITTNVELDGRGGCYFTK